MPEHNGSYYVAPVSVPDRDPDPPDDHDTCHACGAPWYECDHHDQYDGHGHPDMNDHELEKQKALRDDGVWHDGTPRAKR